LHRCDEANDDQLACSVDCVLVLLEQGNALLRVRKRSNDDRLAEMLVVNAVLLDVLDVLQNDRQSEMLDVLLERPPVTLVDCDGGKCVQRCVVKRRRTRPCLKEKHELQQRLHSVKTPNVPVDVDCV